MNLSHLQKLLFVSKKEKEQKSNKRENTTYHDTIILAGRCITVGHTRYFPPKLIILAGTEQPALECLISTGPILSGMPDRAANVLFTGKDISPRRHWREIVKAWRSNQIKRHFRFLVPIITDRHLELDRRPSWLQHCCHPSYPGNYLIALCGPQVGNSACSGFTRQRV